MSTIETGATPELSSRVVRLTLLFAFLATVFDGVELNLLSYPLVYIAGTFQISTSAVVGAITAQGLASLVGGFLFGWMGDVLGRRKAFALCVFVYGIGALLAGIVTTYPAFLVTRVISGVGIGGEFGLAFAMFAEVWKTERRGVMGGAIQSMFIVGEILTQGVLFVTLSTLGDDLGWRIGFVILGALSILVSVAGFIWIPESQKWLEYQRRAREGTLPPELRRTKVPFADMFRGGLARGAIAFIVMATGIFIYSYSLGTFSSTFLLKTAQVPLGGTTVILFLGLLVTIASYMLFSWLSDIVGRRTSFILSNIVGFVGLGFYLYLVWTGNTFMGPDYWSTAMFWALIIAQAGYGGFAIMGVWMAEFFPTRIRSTGSNTAYYIGRGLGAGAYPLIALSLAGGNVAIALGLGIVGVVVALLISIITPDHTGRVIHAIE
jgi:SHS family lactate transporter-like MFS transporter